ncbi:hypothetical protein DICVIV_01373 [Dictyocaulus viviparus]|uniref:Uncharacterized protein n=1 Tax=Dictyocaulus viviparus TaxID=29172 RepID=A0A0D8YCT5_DICVI|nr:hypothetical protein DICVIV_01373 [Dictyocaulus viviparus]
MCNVLYVFVAMKRSSDSQNTEVSRKIIKQDRAELESADNATLVQKILSLTEQLNEANETVKTLKTRVTLGRLHLLQKDKEIKDLVKERNSAYYSGVGTGSAERDQLLDPFFYEAFISMKDKIARREKEIAELKETVKALEGSQDCKILYQFLESKNSVMRKLRENEKNIRKISSLENRLALAHSALRSIRKEKKDYAQEISERDAKIAELEKDLYHFRHSMFEEAVSEHTEQDPEDEVKNEAIQEESDQKLMAEPVEDDCDVVLDDRAEKDPDPFFTFQINTDLLFVLSQQENYHFSKPCNCRCMMFYIQCFMIISKEFYCLHDVHALDENGNGKRLATILSTARLFHGKSCLEEKEHSRWTWESPNGTTKTEIDHILINRRWCLQ